MQTSFKQIRKTIDSLVAIHSNEVKNLANYQSEMIVLETNLEDHKLVREVYQQAAIFTQEYLEEHLSSIVTHAVKSVFFEKDIVFKAKFDKKRNSSECSFSLVENGEEYDILDDKGHGVADIVSFALRVAYILLDSVDNVVIMDEPFRNLDVDRRPHASKMISELSRKLMMQFIIVTHLSDLAECADKVTVLIMKNKRTGIVK